MGKFAIVTAGGYGKRLRPLTETVPKPLLPLGDGTVYSRALRCLKESGFDSVAVTTMYRAAQVEAADTEGLEATYYRESVPLGTAGGIKAAASGVCDDFAVVSGDVVFEFDLADAYRRHGERGAIATVICKRVPYPTEYGTVIARGGRVVAFEEKAPWARTRTDLVNTGIYIFSPRALAYIGDGEQDLAKDLLPRLLKEGEDVLCYEEQGFWCDVGNPASYYECCFRYGEGKNRLFGTASVDGGAFVEGSILFSGAAVSEGASVQGSIICEDVHVGRGSFIGEGCIIGGGTVIGEGAYIAAGTVIKSGAVIGKGARVMKSVYFGEYRRRYIEGGRISGVYGQLMNGELAQSVGAALAEQCGRRGKVGVMHDGKAESRLLAEAVSLGVRLYGVDCALLGDGFESLCAFSAVEMGFEFTVMVKVTGSAASVSLYDKDGLVPRSEVLRRIEQFLSLPRESGGAVGESLVYEDEEGPRFLYAVALTKLVPSLEGARLYIGEKNAASEFLLSVCHKLGAMAEYGVGDRDVFEVAEDGFYAEAQLSGGGECSFWGLICVAGGAAKGMVALPALAPSFVVDSLRKSGHPVSFFGDGGDRSGAYGTFWSYDAVALCLMAIYASVKQGKTIAELDAMVPKRVIESKTVACRDEEKAAAMARIGKDALRGRGGEGVMLRYGGGTVIVVPQETAAFRLFAEAVSVEAAEELFSDVTRRLLGH